jgi:hypothetical protein
MEDYGTNRAIGEGLDGSGNEVFFMKVRIRTANGRAVRVGHAEVSAQEGARHRPERIALFSLASLEVFIDDLLFGDAQLDREAFHILVGQKRLNGLAAIGALPAVDLGSHFFVVPVDDGVDFPGRQIRALQKAAEGPIGIRPLMGQFFDFL